MNGFLAKKQLLSAQIANLPIGTEKKLKLKKHDFYVYVYLDTRKPGTYAYYGYVFDHEPFYVGKGKKDRAYDFSRYIYTRNGLCKYKLKKLKSLNLEPIIKIIKNNLFEKEAHTLEILLINLIGRQDNKTGILCNHTNGGGGASGRIFSEEHKLKIALANTGKRHSEETRRKIGLQSKGRFFSKETRLKMSICSKNRKLSEKHKQILYNANKGRKRSEESKIKMSLAQKGKIITKETKRKMSLSQKGRKHSEESKRKIGLKNLGRKLSEKTKNKMSLSKKGNKFWLGKHHSQESKIKMSLAQKKEKQLKENNNEQ